MHCTRDCANNKMYEIYVATGGIFVIIGLLTTSYLFCVAKVACGNRKHLLTAANTLATISTGIVYIYFATLLQEDDTAPLIHVSVPEDTILNTTNNRITADLFELNNNVAEATTTTEANNGEFLKNYQQLLNSVLKHHRTGKAATVTNNEECLQQIFVQHAMMIYAFVQNVLFLINNCKGCKGTMYAAAYLILLLLLPVLCTVALYYAVFATNNLDDKTTWANELQQINITTTPNSSEINSVVNNIYKIVNSTKTTTLPHNVQFYNNKQTFDNRCNYTTTPFKIYVFLLVILGYITTIFYLKTNELTSGNNLNSNKRLLYLFLATWLPGIADLFTRTFLTEEMPSTLSNVFATLGSANILLINIQDALAITKYNQNMIKPVGDE